METIESEEIESPRKVDLELQIPAQLGEGAFWDLASQKLYWVDILSKQVYIYNPEAHANIGFELPSFVGTVVPQTDTTFVVALENGIYLKNIKTDALTLVSDIEADLTRNRFNDGKADPNGNLWVGSMDLQEKDPVGALYKVTPSGVATTMLEHVTISNGLVWSKDATTFYYIDTPTGVIRAFDFDKATSTISNERVVVTVPETLGFPDGMAIDANDKLWVALWNGNAVVCFDPLSGAMIDRIEVPAHNVTSCAFGGPNFETLYITTASVDMTEEEKEQYPLAGSLFSVQPGVIGAPTTRFGSPK